MARHDLLSLTSDDLIGLSNRGLLRRAEAELESGELTFELVESEPGELVMEWSDQVRCTFPAHKTAAQAHCSCPAVTVCRHRIRSILAYQRHHGPQNGHQAWNPGDISEQELARHFSGAVLKSARSRLEQGLLVEVVGGVRPSARFYQLACTVRFTVPGDIRYAQCECSEKPAPCSHVPLAVWAFRRLEGEQTFGLVDTQGLPPPPPLELLDEVEELLAQIVLHGLGGLTSLWSDRSTRLQECLRQAGLVWPAEALGDLTRERQSYADHDSQFSPVRLTELVGEWLIRADNIRSGSPGVPALFVRGSSADRTIDVGKSSYSGLGCGVTHLRLPGNREAVELSAYLQDNASGAVVAVRRAFSDAPESEPRDFPALAATPAFGQATLAGLGSGMLLTQGGKRSPDHLLRAGRAKSTLYAQEYHWERLRSPVLVEDLDELRARASLQPPSSLRPRLVAANVHVLAIASLESAGFNHLSQSIEVRIRDATGQTAVIEHPYFTRASQGFEALLEALGDESQRLRFVAGQVKIRSSQVSIAPLTMVFERGSTRQGIQPWVESRRLPAIIQAPPSTSPPQDLMSTVVGALGEIMVVGLGGADGATWQRLAREARGQGWVKVARAIEQVSTLESAADVLRLAVICRLAQDLGSGLFQG